MTRSSATVSVAILAIAIAGGVWVVLRDHGDSEESFAASSRSGVNALTSPDYLANSSTVDDRKSSAAHQVGGAPKGDQDQVPEIAGDGHVPWPANIESLIWEYFAHRGKSNITSIISVECTRTDCEIVFTGTEVNPRFVDTFSDLHDDMYAQPWNVRQSGIGTIEIAPGVRAYVIGISNIPFDESARTPAKSEETPAPETE